LGKTPQSSTEGNYYFKAQETRVCRNVVTILIV